MGTCSTITLKDADYAHFVSIYYDKGPGPVSGLQITTNLGDILPLGGTDDSL